MHVDRSLIKTDVFGIQLSIFAIPSRYALGWNGISAIALFAMIYACENSGGYELFTAVRIASPVKAYPGQRTRLNSH